MARGKETWPSYAGYFALKMTLKQLAGKDVFRRQLPSYPLVYLQNWSEATAD